MPRLKDFRDKSKIILKSKKISQILNSTNQFVNQSISLIYTITIVNLSSQYFYLVKLFHGILYT